MWEVSWDPGIEMGFPRENPHLTEMVIIFQPYFSNGKLAFGLHRATLKTILSCLGPVYKSSLISVLFRKRGGGVTKLTNYFHGFYMLQATIGIF